MRYLLLFATVLILGCKNEKVIKPIAVEELFGEWDIFHVTRNGKLTKTLENGYLHFQADNTIKSNLFPDENYHTFIFEQNKVNVVDVNTLKEIKVKSLSQDTLIIDSKVSVFDMQFHLKKR